MADPALLAADVKTENIDPAAKITGQSYLEGPLTAVAAGAIIENSYLKNVVVGPGAVVSDCVIIGSTEGDSGHTPAGYAAHWAIRKSYPLTIGEKAELRHCTVKDACIGPRSQCEDAYIGDGMIGPDNALNKVYAQSVWSGGHVRVRGPTELCGAWLGHHAVIDACGYLEGAFSNDFHVLEFDRQTRSIVVKETLDVPHASRYGLNTINSTNSGNLRDQPGGKLTSLGPYRGLWQDRLLSHEPMVLGPCCWVAGWTKVIGKSAKVHSSASEFVGDLLSTHLMPFSVSGLDGASVTGQVAPGELFNGLMYKQRHAAWAFTHAPTAVISMVQRVAELSGDTALADRLPMLALRSALALVHYSAAQRGIDLEGAARLSSKGWPGWLQEAKRVLQLHIDSGLWEFRNAEPKQWHRVKGAWVPQKSEMLTAIAADALQDQYDEARMLACKRSSLPRTLGVTEPELAAATGETFVDSGAHVAKGAFVGPGVQIRGKSRVEEGAWLWRSVVDNSSVGCNSRVVRANLDHAQVGDDTSVVSSSLVRSSLAAESSMACARLCDATLGGKARVSPYASVTRSVIKHPCIVGSTIADAQVDSTFMSYHMPGQVEHLVVDPTWVTRNGTRAAVHAIPMLGGGLRVLGSKEAPVRMPCAFIGSNAVLEAGAHVGFGCFVLGQLLGSEGLPPFTISTMPGPEHDEIGMVVHRFANVVITHVLSWAFQALGPQKAEDVALMMTTMLTEGRDAVAWAQGCRAAGRPQDSASPYAVYKSLGLYSDSQLKDGLDAYESALADGRWQMAYRDGELHFSGPGEWLVSEGVARWQPRQ
jgi:carbonic anhydrase/acetyltransferase-like protein (isoleucine patch superfamily)